MAYSLGHPALLSNCVGRRHFVPVVWGRKSHSCCPRRPFQPKLTVFWHCRVASCRRVVSCCQCRHTALHRIEARCTAPRTACAAYASRNTAAFDMITSPCCPFLFAHPVFLLYVVSCRVVTYPLDGSLVTQPNLFPPFFCANDIS